MMRKGTDHTLDEEDLWNLPEKDTAEALSNSLSTEWKKQLAKGSR